MFFNFSIFILCVLLSFVLNIFYYRIYKVKNFIVELIAFLIGFISFLYITGINNTYQILYFSFLNLLFFTSYTFVTIMPIEGSPSLFLLTEISKKKKIKKKILYNLFLKKKMFIKRFNSLIDDSYIQKKNSLIKYNKKNLLFINFFLFLEKIQKNKINNG